MMTALMCGLNARWMLFDMLFMHTLARTHAHAHAHVECKCATYGKPNAIAIKT